MAEKPETDRMAAIKAIIALIIFSKITGASAQSQTSVILDVAKDVSQGMWQVFGSYSYLEDESELLDPRFKDILPANLTWDVEHGAKGVWLVLPVRAERNTAKGKFRYVNVVTFSFDSWGNDLALKTIDSVQIRFKGSGPSVIGMYNHYNKVHTTVNALLLPGEVLTPAWFNFTVPMTSQKELAIDFTVKGETDFFIIDKIVLFGERWPSTTTKKPKTTRKPRSTTPASQNEFGLLLVLFDADAVLVKNASPMGAFVGAIIFFGLLLLRFL